MLRRRQCLNLARGTEEEHAMSQKSNLAAQSPWSASKSAKTLSTSWGTIAVVRSWRPYSKGQKNDNAEPGNAENAPREQSQLPPSIFRQHRPNGYIDVSSNIGLKTTFKAFHARYPGGTISNSRSPLPHCDRQCVAGLRGSGALHRLLISFRTAIDQIHMSNLWSVSCRAT